MTETQEVIEQVFHQSESPLLDGKKLVIEETNWMFGSTTEVWMEDRDD